MILKTKIVRVLWLAVFVGAPAGICAQTNPSPGDPPSRVPLHLGPVALAPALTLTNVGWDSNVFNRQEEDAGDFTATAHSELRGWLRVGRARVSGRTALGFVYFRDHASERSVDSEHEGRLDISILRVTPYFSGRWVRARQRFGYEIDERTLRHEAVGIGGLDIRLGARTSLDVAGRRSRLTFDRSDTLLDPVVWQFYDYTSGGVGMTLRQRLTPLTSITATVDKRQDRFDLRPERDSDSLRIASGVEFKPFALVSGSAFVGWQRVHRLALASSEFRGFVASSDLSYTLLGATRFGLQAERTLTYSAIQGQHAYVLAGARLSVTHRFGGGWDVGSRIGRYRLTYDVFAAPATTSPSRTATGVNRESVRQYGGEVGYDIGPSLRVALNVDRVQRRSNVSSGRQYERILAGMSVSYRF